MRTGLHLPAASFSVRVWEQCASWTFPCHSVENLVRANFMVSGFSNTLFLPLVIATHRGGLRHGLLGEQGESSGHGMCSPGLFPTSWVRNTDLEAPLASTMDHSLTAEPQAQQSNSRSPSALTQFTEDISGLIIRWLYLRWGSAESTNKQRAKRELKYF